MSEEMFNRFLLFHPQSNFTYIRKLSMSCGYYMALAVVDSNDRVTHIGTSNNFQIVSFKELSDNDRKILGSDKCNVLGYDDLLSIYRIKKALKLESPYKLHRPCKNMRYTTSTESLELKKLMQDTLDSNNITVENHEHEIYDSGFTDQVEINLRDIDFNNIPEYKNEFPTFDTEDAVGQTRLM